MARGPRHLLLVAAAVVLGCELSARVQEGPLGPAREQERRYMEREPLGPFFERSAGQWLSMRPGSNAKPFPAERPAGRPLVMIAGESVAQRLPAEGLRRALAARGEDAVVVNAGMGGYGSAAVRATMPRLLETKPDAVVLLEGNNGPGPRVGGALSAAASFSALARRLDARLSRPADEELAFEDDLRGAIRAARAAGARVVVAALPANAEEPPNGELPLFDRDFRAGWLALDAGRPKDALEPLARAERSLPGDPFAPFTRAQALRAAGRAFEARAAFAAALALDPAGRCPPRRNAAIRRIAAEEGASLADLEGAFARAGADGRAYLDGVHWRDAWQPLAADVLAAALTGGAPRARAPATPKLTDEEAADLLRHALALSIQSGESGTGILHERFAAELARVAGDAPSVFERGAGSREGARALLETAIRMRPLARMDDAGWAAALIHAAEGRWRAAAPGSPGREAALEPLREAARLSPEGGLAPRLLGLRLLQLGRPAQAREALSRVPRGSRDAPLATALLAGLPGS